MLTPIDFYYLVKELEELIKYKLKNIYFSDDLVFEFKVDGKKYLIVGKNYCYLTDKEFETKKENKFAGFLLRKLKNRKVTKIWQDDFNKIIILGFGDLKLILEFIGKGNIILCENNKIVSALIEREFKDRKILRGENYSSPVAGDYSEKIKEKEKLMKLHIGEIYAEEIVKRNLSLGEILKQKKSPTIYFKDGKKIFISPFELKTLKLENKKLNSFSEVIEDFYRKKSKEEIIKDSQKWNLRKYELEEKELSKKAELLLKYKKEIDESIEKWKNEKKIVMPTKKISGAKISLEINGNEIVIKFGENLQREIDRLYNKSKKAREKVKRIKELIDKNLKIIRTKEEKKEEKKEWYEKFRYFFTSDGFLVIAGKDVETNEKIIKKYCKENDIVLHAHIPSSPFGVIRGEGKKISKQAIEEAAQFVGCYSRFWNSKLGAADVYWVKPEQVSKKVPGHQTIKKGSFMIYGKRNFLRIELKFCIGVDKDLKIVKGPEKAMKKYSKYYIILVPGEKKGKELGKEIKEKLKEKADRKFGEKIEKINIDEFLKVVPYGRGNILES
jgi:predicted ribosome quality control (RQC) complex YloA/Tae2 family protein